MFGPCVGETLPTGGGWSFVRRGAPSASPLDAGAAPIEDAGVAPHDASSPHDASRPPTEASTVQTLYGAEVTFSVHCCTSPPTSTTLISVYETAIVGAGVEFPDISGNGTTVSRPVIDANVDVSMATLEIDYLADAVAVSGSFNGYVFAFSKPADSGVTVPPITNAVLDPSTSVSGATVTFDAATVYINVEGLSIASGTKIVVDLRL